MPPLLWKQVRLPPHIVTGDYMDEEPFCDYVPVRMRRAAAREREMG